MSLQAFHLLSCVSTKGQFVWPDNVPSLVAALTTLYFQLANEQSAQDERARVCDPLLRVEHSHTPVSHMHYQMGCWRREGIRRNPRPDILGALHTHQRQTQIPVAFGIPSRPCPCVWGLGPPDLTVPGFGVPIGSAYLSARRTFGRPIGRPKVRPYLRPADSAGRKYGRTFGQPIGRPKVRPYLRPADRPAEGTV